ncbi:MAG: hypothetical protein K8F91_07075, partial [Candidatus Obscuribacterales bacterium]|nr:hypothetical protein [Candidatus Obscuribacterales bacterium]
MASRKIEFEQNVTLVQADALALCQELAAVASRLLDFALVSWGEKVEIRSFDRMKKHSGSYFTPVALADMVVGRVLGELVAEGRSGPFKIIDPAMGPGIFLLVAIERLKQLACNQGESVFPEDLVDIASGLYGVDLDLANVIVARFCLWFATGTKIEKPFSLMSNLRVGNALLGCSKEEARHIPEAFFKRNDLKLVKRIPSPKKLELKKAIESGYFSNPDRWCALWFAERADLLIDFTCPDWLEKLGQELDKLASREMFFHFQSQYAEVFGEGDNTSGFDAVIGNPPWEIAKPNSREIFARYDPDYWSYGKQKAITIQQELLDRHPDLALHWSNLQKNYQFLIHFLKHAPSQFVRGKKSFCHQGRGDANLYKLFIEQAYALTRSAGVFSLIVPAGIYCDSGCRDLRGLLLKNCRWSSLTGFENVDSAFDIHRSFKYCFFVASKNGTTDSISASFLNTLASADSASLSQNPQFTKEKIDSFSPEHSILLESEGSAALNLLEKIYSGSTPVSRFAAGAY